MSLRLGIAVAATVLGIAACGDGGDTPAGPGGQPVASVRVTPDTAWVLMHGTLQLSLDVRGASGQPISGRPVLWSSSDTSVVGIGGDGIVRGKADGSVRVTATVDGIAGHAIIGVAWPRSDSSSVSTVDSTTVRVGTGSSVTVPAGTLATGSKLLVTEQSGLPPLEGGTMIGDGVRVRFQVGRSLSPVNQEVRGTGELAAVDVGDFVLRIRSQVSGAVDRASETAHVVIRNAADAAEHVVIKATEVIEKVDDYGRRFVETKVVLPASLLVDGAYEWTAQNTILLGRECNASTWKLTRRPLSGQAAGMSPSPNRIPLILVHGWQSDRYTCARADFNAADEVWGDAIAKLEGSQAIRERFDVFVYTYPTFYPVSESAARLRSLVETILPSREIVVVGHSMGGVTAARFVASGGDQVKSLLTFGAPLGGTPLGRASLMSPGNWLAYYTCIPVVAGTSVLIQSLTVLNGATQLDADDPIIKAIVDDRAKFGPVLRTFSGTLGLGQALTLGHDLKYVVGGCLLWALGFPQNDGLVPAERTKESAGRVSFGAVEALNFPSHDHEQVRDGEAPLQTLIARLNTIGGQIASVPTGLQIAGGNNQVAPPGGILPQPVSVRVVDIRGVPVPAVPVDFAVTSGGGSMNPASMVTGADGIARSSWRLGTQAGPQSVQATSSTVPGSSVSFAAVAGQGDADSCPSVAYTPGTVVNGTLTTTDCRFSPSPFGTGAYFDSFETTTSVAQAFRVSMNATFQPAIGVRGPFDLAANYSHAVFATSGSGTINAKVLVPAGLLTFRPAASAPDVTGQYTFSAAATSQDVQGCELVLVLPGVDTQQQLQSTDCNAGGGKYADRFTIGIPVGATLTVEQMSSSFDAYLELSRSGTVVASDDDGGAGTNARLTYTSTQNVVYVISASSFFQQSVGSYRLRVTLTYPSVLSIRDGGAISPTSSSRSARPE